MAEGETFAQTSNQSSKVQASHSTAFIHSFSQEKLTFILEPKEKKVFCGWSGLKIRRNHGNVTRASTDFSQKINSRDYNVLMSHTHTHTHTEPAGGLWWAGGALLPAAVNHP